MTLGISDNVTSTNGELGFCNSPAFDDGTVNKCASCFNLTSDERYMSNCTLSYFRIGAFFEFRTIYLEAVTDL